MKFIKENRRAFFWMAVGALFLIIGVSRGETEIVLRKAVNICMECIGLG
ncbi:MAG: CD1871A family CXXC motif-containing protein [Ruminococcus sp.]|jgi:hypothetical protein